MWTATIKSNSMDTLGRIVVSVVYSNGTKEIPEAYSLVSVDNIQPMIDNRLQQLQGIEDYLVKPSIGLYVKKVATSVTTTNIVGI